MWDFGELEQFELDEVGKWMRRKKVKLMMSVIPSEKMNGVA